MNRPEFSTLLPTLLTVPALAAHAQTAQTPTHGLPKLGSGIYQPGPPSAQPPATHISHHYILGILPDSIRLEAHDSWQAPGAPHEAIGHHKHSEIWFIKEGEAILMTAGVERHLKAGEMGICIAGDEHFIANASQTDPVNYLVLTVGPPE